MLNTKHGCANMHVSKQKGRRGVAVPLSRITPLLVGHLVAVPLRCWVAPQLVRHLVAVPLRCWVAPQLVKPSCSRCSAPLVEAMCCLLVLCGSCWEESRNLLLRVATGLHSTMNCTYNLNLKHFTNFQSQKQTFIYYTEILGTLLAFTTQWNEFNAYCGVLGW
jgi:hypothetical protein